MLCLLCLVHALIWKKEIYFFFRAFLKDMLPLTEEHFVFGTISDEVRAGKINGDEQDDWTLPNLPIKIQIPGSINEHILDYVEACPSN